MIHLLCYVAGTALWQAWSLLPWLTFILLASSSAALVYRKKHVAALVLLLGFSLAMHRLPAQPPLLQQGPSMKWDNRVALGGYFSEPPRHYDRFNSQSFVPDIPPEGFSNESAMPAEFNVLSDMEFDAGRHYTLRLRMVTPRERKNPGAWPASVYGRLKSVEAEAPAHEFHGGIRARMARLRQQIATAIDSRFSPEAAALIKAVTVGLKSDIPLAMRRDFQRTGLAHLLSISGTHFGFFAVTLFFSLRFAINRLPARALTSMTLYISPSQAAALLTLPPMLLYLGLSGATPPPVRAFVMISLFLFGLLISASGRWHGYLAAAAFVIAVHDPSAVTSLSFVMSFAAVIFIGLIFREEKQHENGFIKEKQPRISPWRKAINAIMVRPFQMTLAATLGVMPLVMYWFHTLSLISPLANVAVTGTAGLLLVPLSIAGAMSHAFFGSFITAPIVGPLAELCISLTRELAAPEWASLSVPPMPAALLLIYYASVLPWLITRRRRLMPLILIPLMAYSFFAFMSATSKEVSITMLDTGRSDAMVMELPGRRAVVIDTGYAGTEVMAYLRYRGIQKIEAMALTHDHKDHTGGAKKLARYFEVAELWDNGKLKKRSRQGLETLPRRRLKTGDVIALPGVEIRVLHPPKGYRSPEGGSARTNNPSLVLRVEAKGGSSILLAGDVQGHGIETLSALGANATRSDVLKIPHHGKDPEMARDIIQLTRPSMAVQTGYGSLDIGDLPLWSTTRDGAVKVILSSLPPEAKGYAAFMPVKNPPDLRTELKNLTSLFSVW